jgi:hypothetical protein
MWILLGPFGCIWQGIHGAPKKKSCFGAAGWLESRTAQSCSRCPYETGGLWWPGVQLEISNSESADWDAGSRSCTSSQHRPSMTIVNLCQSMSINVNLINLKWVHGCDQARTWGGFLNHSSFSGGFVHMALGPRIGSSKPLVSQWLSVWRRIMWMICDR